MVKRIFLFGIVNILVLLSLWVAFTVIAGLLGAPVGYEYTIWLWYSVLGFGGAFVSLAISRHAAKWSMGVRVIDDKTQNPRERRLLETVHDLARKAGLSRMPEVGIYDSVEVNAFATGPAKSHALVAVSTGLLHQMDDEAVEGVLGHEVAHIANGDMVTMTLLQGVINTMVLIVARIFASLVSSSVQGRSRDAVYFLIFMILQIVLSLFGSLVIAYFSRHREYRADNGGALLAGRERMIHGLKSLAKVYGDVDDSRQSQASLKISGHTASGFAALFATHPPIEARLRELDERPVVGSRTMPL